MTIHFSIQNNVQVDERIKRFHEVCDKSSFQFFSPSPQKFENLDEHIENMAQERIYNEKVKMIMKKIKLKGLMSEQLEDLFYSKIIAKVQANQHQKLVDKYTLLVKDMFQGVIHHKYCLGIAQKMVKLMNKNPNMEPEYACRICAEEINTNKGQTIFPLDEEAFENMCLDISK